MPLIRLLQTLAALLVSATALLIALVTVTAFHDHERTHQGLAAIDQLRLALLVAEMASRERGPANGVLGDDAPPGLEHKRALAEARLRTDQAFDAFETRAAAGGAAREAMIRQARSTRQALAQARAEVDRVAALAKAERPPERISAAVHGMVAVVPRIAPILSELANEAQTAYPPVAGDLQAARLAAELREYAGLLGSHFTAALAREQPFTRAELDEIAHTHGRIDELRFLIDIRMQRQDSSGVVAQAWKTAQDDYFGRAIRLADGIVAASDAGARYGLDPARFADAYVPDMNAILAVRDVLLERAHAQAEAAHGRAARVLAGVVAGVSLLLGVLLAAIAIVQRRILAPLAAIARAVHALARNQSEAALPQAIADDEMAAVIGAVAALQDRERQRLALERERDSLIERLRDQSNTDALTGLANRRGFLEAAEHALAVARRRDTDLAAILLDVDHFKRVNDQFGHAAGDQVLATVAGVIRRELRQSDLVARFGGEEFVVLLNDCDLAQGLVFAERLRAAIEAAALALPDAGVLRVTASFGVAAISGEPGATLERMLSHADAAMYRAKSAGRNRIAAADAQAVAAQRARDENPARER